MPDGLDVDVAPRPCGRILLGKAVMHHSRARQRHGVGRLAHLVDVELPLHEGNDPPVVVVHEDRSRAQPSVSQALQRE
jgi:hypothetical protein